MHSGKPTPAPALDLIVVGGGPAGSAAAILAKRAGLSVALLEAHPFPRARPGETLPPAIEPLMERLSPALAEAVREAGFVRHEGHWTERATVNQAVSEPHTRRHFLAFGADANGPWRGFHAPRARFDALLLDEARRCGVAILQPCRALRPLWANRVDKDGMQSVVGVRTDMTEDLYAPFVIDAAGGRHWLARHRGAEPFVVSPRLIARYGYRVADPTDGPEGWALWREEAHGWEWRAHIGGDRCAWVRLDKSKPAGAKRVAPDGTRGEDVTWRIAAPCAGPGYFLAGDSASVVDPSAGHGVLKALMSGMLAAHAVVGVLGENLPPEVAAYDYHQFVEQWFHHDTTHLTEMMPPVSPASGNRHFPTTLPRP